MLLIAEDEELIRILVVEYLQDAGFKVIEAVNAAHALAVINEAGPIALVFTDIQMPGEMDGQALAHWLHQHRPDVPVLLTSGVERPLMHPSRNRRFIPKPYALTEVERHIRELLHRAF